MLDKLFGRSEFLDKKNNEEEFHSNTHRHQQWSHVYPVLLEVKPREEYTQTKIQKKHLFAWLIDFVADRQANKGKLAHSTRNHHKNRKETIIPDEARHNARYKEYDADYY